MASAQHKRPLCVRSDPLSAFDGPVFTSSSGSNVLEIDIYGLREGGGTFCFWITFLFFTPFYPRVAFFFSFHASFIHTEGHSPIFEANVCVLLSLASISITARSVFFCVYVFVHQARKIGSFILMKSNSVCKTNLLH